MAWMKRILLLLFLFIPAVTTFGDLDDYGFRPLRTKVHTKEDFFRLYNQWLYADLDSISRNILFLELGYCMPFDHPIKALTVITNEVQYQKYKSLLMMRICTLLTHEYMSYATMFVKENIYFFNKEFFKEYLDGYDIAEFYYTEARKYWHEAIEHAKVADSVKGYHMDLNFSGPYNYDFEDEVYRIKYGMVYYDETIDRRLALIEKNRAIISNLMNSNAP